MDGDELRGGDMGMGRERESIERLGERYLRWLLGVDRRTLGYIVREELGERAGRERGDLRGG